MWTRRPGGARLFQSNIDENETGYAEEGSGDIELLPHWRHPCGPIIGDVFILISRRRSAWERRDDGSSHKSSWRTGTNNAKAIFFFSPSPYVRPKIASPFGIKIAGPIPCRDLHKQKKFSPLSYCLSTVSWILGLKPAAREEMANQIQPMTKASCGHRCRRALQKEG